MEHVKQWSALVLFESKDGNTKNVAAGFHAFLRDVLKGYKYATVREDLLTVPADTVMPGATSAISLAIWPEGFTSVMTWLQVHRPPPLPIIIVPLNSQGDHHPELLQRSLWLGIQPEVGSDAMEALSALLKPADAPMGTKEALNPSKAWGHFLFAATDEMVALRDKAAASLVHFHAHVFVDPADVAGTTPAWKEFYARCAAAFKDHRYVVEDRLVEGPIGPHPASQFEIVFFRPAYQEFLTWLLFNRPAQLPTLIHPMLYNTKADELFGEYLDHGRRAIWLGKQVPNLDLDILATIDEKVHAGTERPYAMFDWQRPRGQEGSPAIDISA